MKPLYPLLALLLLTAVNGYSQKIMDAKLTAAGDISIYLTETENISEIKIEAGSVPDSSDIHSARYFSLADFQSHGGTVDDNNVLKINIGNLPSAEVYARITIVIPSGAREISIKAGN